MASNCNIYELLDSLKKVPTNRTEKDVLEISLVIRKYFESLDFETIQYLSNFSRYAFFEKNSVIYSVDDFAECWYILLSGAISLKGKVFQAPCSFGKRYNGQIKRVYQCTAVEDSQLMKILYPSAEQVDASVTKTSNHSQEIHTEKQASSDGEDEESGDDDDEDDDDETLRDSFSELDFSDLANDSFTSITVKDVVQECLEKLPQERTEQDIKILKDFMLHFNVFNSFPKEVQHLICCKLSYIVVEKEGTVVVSEGEEFHYWAMVINGCLEMVHPSEDCHSKLIHMGEWFGIDPYNESAPRRFTIVTRLPSCHYISLTKDDWDSIRNKEGKSVEKETIEDGKKVLVVEERDIKKSGHKGYLVKKGTCDQLIRFLVDDCSVEDPTYVEDFLLTSRTFLREDMSSLTDYLATWFSSTGKLRDKSVRIVLLWVNNHFEDFETDFDLNNFLMKFMQLMQQNNMTGQLDLLHRACCAKARLRKVTLNRNSLLDPWGFDLVFGKESGKVFVDHTLAVNSRTRHCDKVHTGSDSFDDKTSSLLMKGDQILEANGKNLSMMNNKCFSDLINESFQLELLLKCNFVDYREVMISGQKIKNIFPKQSYSHEEGEKVKKKSDWMTKRIFNNVIEPLIRKISFFSNQNTAMSPSLGDRHKNSRIFVTGSNPDLSNHSLPSINSFVQDLETNTDDCEVQNMSSSEEILKVYLTSHTKPILLVANKNMNAAHVIKKALKSIRLHDESSYTYSLYEVTFKDGKVIKHSRLPDCCNDLISKTTSDTRLYLVNNSILETNWANELAMSFGQDVNSHQNQPLSLWHMKPHEVATELCLRDFKLFRDIRPSEYVEYVFNKDSGHKTENLTRFSKLVNEEMFWVVTEICSEANLDGRVKLVQCFLKISQHCLEMNNFNSTFAILSGLRHNSVSKLKQTWKRLPTKYMKLFESLQDLLDPSNNMSKYRSLLNFKLAQDPAIPFFPIVMKDLTFIDLGNKTYIDGMINYEKMRMVAKQIRNVTNMASTFYHNKNLEMQRILNSDTASQSSVNVAAFATIRKKKTPHIMSTQLKSEEYLGLTKKYFENLKTIQDEVELEKMSLSVERQKGSKSHSKGDVSPQYLTKSNNRLSSSKFGMESPQSIQKIMGLTDKIVPCEHQLSSNNLQQQNNKKRPNALSLSGYDAIMMTIKKGQEFMSTIKRGHDGSNFYNGRRGAAVLSPTGSNSRHVKHLPAVRLLAESSSVSSVPVRCNSSVNYNRNLNAAGNQKLTSMNFTPKSSSRYSTSSSVEDVEHEEVFSGPCLQSQSTPVSPCRFSPNRFSPCKISTHHHHHHHQNSQTFKRLSNSHGSSSGNLISTFSSREKVSRRTDSDDSMARTEEFLVNQSVEGEDVRQDCVMSKCSSEAELIINKRRSLTRQKNEILIEQSPSKSSDQI